MYKNASPSEGYLFIKKHGGIILTCDSIKNWVKIDPFFSEGTTKIAIAHREIAKARISPLWLNATGVQKVDFESLLKLEFKHIISAHGKVLKKYSL